MTLNRVIGNEKSIIAGALNATGKVYLINANGILFTQGASVNTAGLIASTLNITNEDFLNGNYVFQGNGQSGSVINMGVIKATGDGTGGGYVALLGDQVKNEGIIIAERGTVSLNGAQKVTLNFNGDSLANVTLDEGSLSALVENKKAIIADGGKVILTAKAANDLVSSQVNVDGIVQAQTLADLTGGSIEVNAYGGTTTVSGTLDASAPNGGNGGTIETSGTTVKVADTATITTAAAKGTTGTWTIDPDGFTIAAYGGDMTGATLGRQLASNNVTIFSTQGSGTNGDINVNDTVTWAAATLLTLNATKAITVNGSIAPTGTGGGVALLSGTNITLNTPLSLGANSFAATAGGTITLAAPLSWTGNQTVALTAAEDLKLYSTITGEGGTLNLTATSGSVDLDGATSLGATTVNVAAGTDVNLNAALTWTGDTVATLTAGNNININAPLTATGTNAGLVMNYGNDYNIWTKASYSGAVLNSDGIAVAQTAPDDAVYGSITLSGANASLTMNGHKYTLVHGMSDFDSLLAYLNDNKLTGACSESSGTCYWNPSTQSYDIAQSKPSVGTCASGGGSCWWNTTTQSYDIADIDSTTGMYYRVTTGGYTGSSSYLYRASSYTYYYNIKTSLYDTRSVYAGNGYYYNAATGLYDITSAYYAISNDIDASASYSSSALMDENGKYYYSASPVSVYSGTLAGLGHTIDNLTIAAASQKKIGFIGTATSGSVLRDIGLNNVNIEGKQYVGALVGNASGALTVAGAYSTGSVTGATYVGGLIGSVAGNDSDASNVSYCFSTADVTASTGTSAGGLIGMFLSGFITHAHATGNVTSGSGYIGGLVGALATIYGSSIETGVDLAYATSTVVNTGTPSSKYTSYAVGGLVGYAAGSPTDVQITNSFATGDVSGYAIVGGLVGYGTTVNIDNTYHTTGTVTSSGYHYLTTGDYTSGTGGLAGVLVTSDVANSFSTGDVISTLDSSSASGIGGLIGYFNGRTSANGLEMNTITSSFATGNVIAQASSQAVGGLVGYIAKGNINKCYANVNVTGGNYVGGLVGLAYSTKTSVMTDVVQINNSTAYGTVTGNNYVGGILGYGNGTGYSTDTGSYVTGSYVLNSTSYTTVTGNDYVGGIAGFGNIITDSTASGTVIGTGSNVGPVMGTTLAELVPLSTGNSYSPSTSYTVPTTPGTTSVAGTSPGLEAATTASDATSAAATSASSVISNIQSQAASAAYVARMEAISQVVEVADGQQLSVSQSAPTTKEVVTPNTTKEISLAEAIRNFAEDGGSADNAGVSGASYSAGIKTVTADGVTYIVDESNQTSDDNKDKKNAKKSE